MDRPADQVSSKNQPASERGPGRRLTREISTYQLSSHSKQRKPKDSGVPKPRRAGELSQNSGLISPSEPGHKETYPQRRYTSTLTSSGGMAGRQAPRDSPGGTGTAHRSRCGRESVCFQRGPGTWLPRRTSTVSTELGFPREGTKGLWSTKAKGSMRALPETWCHRPQGTGGRGEMP